MGRGHKKCDKCSFEMGPRSRNCPKCGQGQIVKGRLYANVSPNPHFCPKNIIQNPPGEEISPKNIKSSADLIGDNFTICLCENEKRVRTKYYGKKSKTFESLDGNFRVRYSKEFLGVSFGDKKYYQLLRNNNGLFEPVGGKNRFLSLRGCLKKIKKIKGKLENGGAEKVLSILKKIKKNSL